MRGENRNHFLGDSTAVCGFYLSRIAFLCVLFTLILTACSFKDSSSKNARQQIPPPVTQTVVPAKPSTMDTYRALAPAEGLKFTPLFATPVKDTDQRIARVEDAVQELRNDFDTVMPSIVRLVAVEKDIKELIGQLKTLTDSSPVARVEPPAQLPAPVKQAIPGEDTSGGTEAPETAKADSGVPTAGSSLVTPEVAPKGVLPPEGATSPISLTSPKPKGQAPPAGSKPDAQQTPAAAQNPAAATQSLNEIQGVRIGDHTDKTRVVLDLNGNLPLKATLGADGKQLIIDLQQAKWSGRTSWDANSGNLVSGYRYADGKLMVDLMYPSTIKEQQNLEGDKSKGGRFMIDLVSADVHHQ